MNPATDNTAPRPVPQPRSLAETMPQTAARAEEGIMSRALLYDLAALTTAGLGNALLAARVNWAPLALGVIACALVVRVIQYRTKLLALPLHLPWLLFILSAYLGVSVSFDPALSLSKFQLFLGGIALYYVIATLKTRAGKELVVWGLLLVCAGVAIYFVTQTDFTIEPVKVGILNNIGIGLHQLSPQLGLHTPHANLMAGILLLGLPYALALSFNAARQRRWLVLVASSAFVLVITYGLVMTTSRGAWLALALLGFLAMYGYGAVLLAHRAGYSTGIGIAAAINLLLIGLVLLTIVGGNRVTQALDTVLGSAGGIARLELYQEAFELGQDVSFTGIGLNTFSPNFSTYARLIDVPLLPHAHNLLLEVWLEQGALGLLAFLWLIVAYYAWTFARWRRMNWLALASSAAVTLMLLHGLVDVIFYFSRVIALMFIPLGLTVCALHPLVPLSLRSAQRARRFQRAMLVIATLFIVLFVVLTLTRPDVFRAQWLANLGAVRQAQLELPQVEFPHPTPHEVRRTTDLSEAEGLLHEALLRDPANRVAHARLGLIALDRAEFARAIEHLEAAYSQDPHDRSLVKALGYAYVWTDRLREARALLAQIPEAQIEMRYAVDDWRRRGRSDLSVRAAEMVQQLSH